MNILDEWWKRLLISFFLGKIISEGIGLVSYKKVEISSLLIALILYFVLSGIYKRGREKNNNSEPEEFF